MGEEFLAGVNFVSTDPLGELSPEETLDELRLIADEGARVVRLLLPWSELQPERHRVPEATLRRIERALDAMEKMGLRALPIFFCSGLDSSSWLPQWMCERPGACPRVLDFYRERDLIRAQQLQLSVVAGAFSGHGALLGWDLGRQTTRLAPAPDPETARSWLLWLLEAVKKHDEGHAVTFTLSQSDFEQDHGIRPSRMAEELDFLSLQAAPAEASWSDGAADAEAVGLICALAHRFSAKPVLVSELVVPPPGRAKACFLEDALERARQAGALGGLVWAHRDLPEANISGLVTQEGDTKPEGESFRRFALGRPQQAATPRLDANEASFYEAPHENLRKAYMTRRKGAEDDQNDASGPRRGSP